MIRVRYENQVALGAKYISNFSLFHIYGSFSFVNHCIFLSFLAVDGWDV